MDKNIALVAQVVAELTEMGIIAVDNPTASVAYKGAWGSIANYAKVTIGPIREMQDPVGDVHLGVFVNYEARRESGEDFCDYSIKESRNVELSKLLDYLAERGIKTARRDVQKSVYSTLVCKEVAMQKFRFRYTLRNGQTGSGVILAPCLEAVGMLVRDRFKLSDDVRIYEVEEVPDGEE